MKRSHFIFLTLLLFIILIIKACSSKRETQNQTSETEAITSKKVMQMAVNLTGYDKTNFDENDIQVYDNILTLRGSGWLSYTLNVPVTGRYNIRFNARNFENDTLWVEDYIYNKDGRTYDVTGKIEASKQLDPNVFGVDGSPLAEGEHRIKIHVSSDSITINDLSLELNREHERTDSVLIQKMDGEEWKLVWSDEFEGDRVDTMKWNYDVGNWGWGNNELQYYTVNDTTNARVEKGRLVIEARKNKSGQGWTSARLTTRGRITFKYGKIEFRAKVPRNRGNWAAGWTLGDSYRDELSWPYCGEIDILESVGYEVDDKTGDGIAHATVHTPAYYFKIGNQISSQVEVKDIADEFHTYSVVWTPREIKAFVDGNQYYLYDKNANDMEWPFNQPQNLILNLAMGGGWGGAQGVDPNITTQQFLIDYVRVYAKE